MPVCLNQCGKEAGVGVGRPSLARHRSQVTHPCANVGLLTSLLAVCCCATRCSTLASPRARASFGTLPPPSAPTTATSRTPTAPSARETSSTTSPSGRWSNVSLCQVSSCPCVAACTHARLEPTQPQHCRGFLFAPLVVENKCEPKNKKADVVRTRYNRCEVPCASWSSFFKSCASSVERSATDAALAAPYGM